MAFMAGSFRIRVSARLLCQILPHCRTFLAHLLSPQTESNVSRLCQNNIARLLDSNAGLAGLLYMRHSPDLRRG